MMNRLLSASRGKVVKKRFISTLRNLILFLFIEISSPAFENNLSEGTDVAGMERFFLAILDRWDRPLCSLTCCHLKGSSFWARFVSSRYAQNVIIDEKVNGLDWKAAICWSIRDQSTDSDDDELVAAEDESLLSALIVAARLFNKWSQAWVQAEGSPKPSFLNLGSRRVLAARG